MTTREDADKQRLGIDILKEKSKQHGANVCTTDGRPPDPDYAELHNAPRPGGGGGQHGAYYVLCEEERRKGFVRPVRDAYRHVGMPSPRFPLRELTEAERARVGGFGYVKFEEYPESESPSTGRYWTQAQLDKIGKGCGTVTTMGRALAETYARDPGFYGSTFCCACGAHFPVGEIGEFVWVPGGERVGHKKSCNLGGGGA